MIALNTKTNLKEIYEQDFNIWLGGEWGVVVIFDDFVIEIDFSLDFDLIIWVGARSE